MGFPLTRATPAEEEAAAAEEEEEDEPHAGTRTFNCGLRLGACCQHQSGSYLEEPNDLRFGRPP